MVVNTFEVTGMDTDKQLPNHWRVKESGWTVEEYMRLPEDGNQYEIIGGKLELKPSPTTTHQRVSSRLEYMLKQSCDQEFILLHAPMDVVLAENETRQPDILLIHRSRGSIIKEHAWAP